MNQTQRAPSPSEIKSRIIKELNETSDAVKALRTPPFHIKEVFDLVVEIVSMVEHFALPHMNGATKRAIANGVIAWVDREFRITQIIYKSLFGKFFLFKLIPAGFKRTLIREVMEMAVGIIVMVLNKVLWKAESESESE